MALQTGDMIMALFKRSKAWKDLQGEDLQRFKGELVSIVEDIVNVCEKYHLTYIMSYGTALGAVRHKGFIPWDDDMDISMPRSDYNKFLTIAEQELGDSYFIRCVTKGDPILVPTCHIKKKGTRYVNYGDMVHLKYEPEETKCIYVDIFPMENTYNNTILRIIDGYTNFLLQFIINCMIVRDSLKTLQEMGVELTPEEKSAFRLKRTIGLLMGWCPVTKLVRFYDRFSSKYKNNNSKYVTSLTAYKRLRKSTYLRDKVLKTTVGEFEGHRWNLPADYDYYLTCLYGDYMTPPDSNHHKVHPVFELELSKKL